VLVLESDVMVGIRVRG